MTEPHPANPPAARTPRVSVILPTCGRAGLLCECVDSIRAGDYDDFEVIVVDQDPSQALRGELARRYAGDGRVRYVYQAEAAADRARNAGIAQARGEILVIADDDVEVDRAWLRAYVEAFDAVTPTPGLVAGRLEPRWVSPRPAWWPAEYDYLLGLYHAGDELAPMPAGHLPISANLAVLHRVAEEVGGFDERVDYSYARKGAEMLTGGDSLFGRRVRDAGHAIYYQPRAVAWHKISARKLAKGWFLRRSFWEGCTQAVLAYLSDPEARYGLGGMERVHAGRVLRLLLAGAAGRGPREWLSAAGRMRVLGGCAQSLGVIWCSRRFLRRQLLPGETPVRLGREQPMRVGVDCFHFRPDMGGMRQYLLTTLSWLLEHDRRNEYVVFHSDESLPELAAGLPAGRWERRAVRVAAQRDLPRHAVGKVDVMWCPFTAYWPRPVGRPTVLTCHDIQEVRHPEFFSPADRFTRALNFPASTRAADHVIAISRFTREAVVEHHGVPVDRVSVVHNSVDARYYRAAEVARPPAVAAKLPVGRFVLYPANRWRHKNHDGLLRAMALLRGRGRDVPAVFTGHDVPGGYPLAEMARRYGVADLVHEAGYVDVEEMCWLYRGAAMLVFPSLYEGFGIPVVEAMAAGCPVACADRTSLPEIAGDAAVLFDPASPEAVADAIARLWDDEALRRELVTRGLRRAGDFAVERAGRAHVEAFRRAIGSYSPLRAAVHRRVYEPAHTLKVLAMRRAGFFD